MNRFVFTFKRGLVFALVIGFFGTLAVIAIPGLVLAQDAPAADCDAGPQVICPSAEDPSAQYIGSVTAAPDGIVILLTNDGLDKARECDGSEAIAVMAQELYDAIPADQKADFQLDWTSQQLIDEIYGHAFFARLVGGGSLDSLLDRANPINVDFADYGGPGTMTLDARAEQETFAALGAIHRASC